MFVITFTEVVSPVSSKITGSWLSNGEVAWLIVPLNFSQLVVVKSQNVGLVGSAPTHVNGAGPLVSTSTMRLFATSFEKNPPVLGLGTVPNAKFRLPERAPEYWMIGNAVG